MTDFIDKVTIIEPEWANAVDAVCLDVFQSATSAALARAAIDVPQETAEVVPQVRVNGSWQALSGVVGPLHAATHVLGGTDPVNHDMLLNGSGVKHVDHSTLMLTAGSGLTGGGSLDVGRTVAFSYLLERELNAGHFHITNLLDPADAHDAVNKAYADNLVIQAGANPWQGGVPADSIHYSTGFVGIGTDTPIYDLDVRGDGQITGTLHGAAITMSGVADVGSLDVGAGATVHGVLSAGSISTSGTLAAGATTVNGVLSAGSISTAGTLTAGSTTVNGDITIQ